MWPQVRSTLSGMHGDHAVIDHHDTPGDLSDVDFVDVRRNLGATCSIVTSYLIEQEIALPARLATGLLYGIETELSGWPREAGQIGTGRCGNEARQCHQECCKRDGDNADGNRGCGGGNDTGARTPAKGNNKDRQWCQEVENHGHSRHRTTLGDDAGRHQGRGKPRQYADTDNGSIEFHQFRCPAPVRPVLQLETINKTSQLGFLIRPLRPSQRRRREAANHLPKSCSYFTT